MRAPLTGLMTPLRGPPGPPRTQISLRACPPLPTSLCTRAWASVGLAMDLTCYTMVQRWLGCLGKLIRAYHTGCTRGRQIGQLAVARGRQ
jgi:hypothetical protein